MHADGGAVAILARVTLAVVDTQRSTATILATALLDTVGAVVCAATKLAAAAALAMCTDRGATTLNTAAFLLSVETESTAIADFAFRLALAMDTNMLVVSACEVFYKCARS